MLIDLDRSLPRTYVARGNPRLELILTFGGGILSAIFIVIMIAAMFNAPATGNFSHQPGFVGGFSVIPIMLIARGLFAMRNITRLTLDQSGLALESPTSFKTIPWTQIARIQKKDRSSFMGESHETLILLDSDGKQLAQIRDTLDRFPDLLQQIEIRSASVHGAPITESDEDIAAEIKKARRRAKLVGSLFALLTLGMLAGAIASFIDMSHEKKLARESTSGEAKVLKHYMVRQTPYLEFEFTDPAGQTHHRVTMMQTEPWESLAGAKTVPIIYARSDPSLFRLVQGEDHPGFAYFWLVALIAGLVFAVGTVFTFLGYDIKSKGGITQITRWGQPLD